MKQQRSEVVPLGPSAQLGRGKCCDPNAGLTPRYPILEASAPILPPTPQRSTDEGSFVYPFNDHLLSTYWVRAKVCAGSGGARRRGPDWQGRGTERKVSHETPAAGAAGRQAGERGSGDESRGMRDDGGGMRDQGAADARAGVEWEERGPGDGVGGPAGPTTRGRPPPSSADRGLLPGASSAMAFGLGHPARATQGLGTGARRVVRP